MSNPAFHAVKASPAFRELAQKRSLTAWSLTAIVLGTYYCYMLVVALRPDILHAPLAEGGMLTVGVPVAALIIVFSWAMTGVYIWRANGEFDRLNRAIIEEAGK
ncbi:MAG: DUF485 domain-containing protein [Laribacter sp.]|nr:DUF485 domain-containing protein [Laribacter sp.]MBP9528479.1 DUF485 domain-containing protein [Laribacter sp.]MBP9609717.1 DUF485 domain-containing protein [Laribacter sp.]